MSAIRLRRSNRPTLAALDGGGAILQRRLRDVMLGAAIILVPTVAINLWATVVSFERFDPDDSLLPTMSTDTIGAGVEDVAAWLGVVFVSAVTAVLGFFAAQILLGERFVNPVPLRQALLATLRRAPAVLALWVLTHWWAPLLSWLMLTGDNDDLGGYVTLYLLAAWFASAFTLLAVPAMVGERLGPVGAAVRAFRLARMRFGSCLGFVLLSTVLGGAFLFGLATLAPLLEVTGFIGFGDFAWLVQGVLVQFGVLLVMPLIALATAQLYLEVRLDAEALDLVIDTDAAFGVRA